MLDTESLLLVSIFQKAYPLSPRPPAEMFLHHFAVQIDGTCGVLKLLGLVEVTSSSLGFKPTHRLIEIITDRMVQPTVESKSAVGNIETNFVDSLWRLVAWNANEEEEREEEDERDEQEKEDEIGDCEGGGDGLAFCRRVFVVLGLLREEADRYVPTRLIQNLIFKNWVEKLSKSA
jgi:hypothetical protein